VAAPLGYWGCMTYFDKSRFVPLWFRMCVAKWAEITQIEIYKSSENTTVFVEIRVTFSNGDLNVFKILLFQQYSSPKYTRHTLKYNMWLLFSQT
jgi:hypothetical protein